MEKTINELNVLINECINKYDLEGHQTAEGGMAWFARCLLKEGEEVNCIDDLEKAGIYSFNTPRYTGENVNEIYEILKHHTDIIESKLN